MSGALTDKVGVIFGAATGIGRATASAFAYEGARLVLADVAVDALAETAELARASGADVIVSTVDVRDGSAVGAAVLSAVERFGRLDCGVNVAGFEGNELVPMLEASDDNFDAIIGVNLKGMWTCMRHELRELVAGGGTIVNMASTAALVGFPGLAAYSASKGGVLALTRAAALEYAAAGVRINAVCPGAVDTPMRQRVTERRVGAAQPDVSAVPGTVIGVGSPEEIANAVVWLSSDASSFCTGHGLVVDGGYTAR
jgi:NAD(P)-dependent dehydrogenase (short-subunit alcohol dehydrogenase family)